MFSFARGADHFGHVYIAESYVVNLTIWLFKYLYNQVLFQWLDSWMAQTFAKRRTFIPFAVDAKNLFGAFQLESFVAREWD